MQMTVISRNGEPVRVREHPSTSAATIGRLKVGTTVEAGDCVNGWRRITWGEDMPGYMMDTFLRAPGQPDRTLSEADYNRLCDTKCRLEEALRVLRQIVG